MEEIPLEGQTGNHTSGPYCKSGGNHGDILLHPNEF